jgi:hypothetical protein
MNIEVVVPDVAPKQWGVWWCSGDKWQSRQNFYTTWADAMGALLRLYISKNAVSGWVIHPQ